MKLVWLAVSNDELPNKKLLYNVGNSILNDLLL